MNGRVASSLLFVALLAACGGPRPLQLPPQAAGWTLASSRDLPLAQAPPEAQALGLVRAVESTYQGAVTLRVVVYQMKSDTAFELMQKWRRQPATFPFYSKRFLVVVEPLGGTLDRASLDRFSRAFEAGLPGS